jgi:phage tail protein X
VSDYTILSKAGDDLAEQGRLVDWHCKRMEDRAHRYATQYAAVNAEIADLSERLRAATATLLDMEARHEREDAWDWAHLLDWFLHAPQHAGMQAKSLHLSRGVTIGARKLGAKLNILDDAYLMTALPDCTETVTKLKVGEAKKRLAVTPEGRVAFIDSGELLPEGIVEVERLEGDTYYIKAPDALGDGETTYTIHAGLGDLPEDAEDETEEAAG